MTLTAEDLKRIYQLEPLGFEGGFFCESFRSDHLVAPSVLPPGPKGPRALHTAIYYLLTPQSSSMMHRLQCDEIYHFYLGDPVEFMFIDEAGRPQVLTLGQDVAAGQRVQFRVPAHCWQGSHLIAGGRFAFMGTTMTPGFDLEDFELGQQDALVAAHPEHRRLLTTLTQPIPRS